MRKCNDLHKAVGLERKFPSTPGIFIRMEACAKRLVEVESKIGESSDPLSESHFLSHTSETAVPITVGHVRNVSSGEKASPENNRLLLSGRADWQM